MFEIIGGIANAIRGGQMHSWIGRPIPKPDIVNALLYGICVYSSAGEFWLAVMSCFAMFLGAVVGVGDYIGALYGTRKVVLSECWFIDPMIRPLQKWPELWGYAGLTLRGLYWGACLATPFLLYGYEDQASSLLLHGSMMPLAYVAAYFWIKTRIPTLADRAGVSWGLAEVFYGAILWSALD